MSHSQSTRMKQIIAVVFTMILVAGCSSSEPVGARRSLDPALPTAVPIADDLSAAAPSDAGSDAAPTAVPTPAPTVGPIDCASGDPGGTFTVPLTLVPGQSLDLVVEIRDQSGSGDQPDTVRSWPVTVTVSDRVEDDWLMIWEATRSALDLPVGFSTSDANDLQQAGLPPMPPAFYRITLDGQFKAMEIPDGFGRGVAQAVRNMAADQTDTSLQDSLATLADLYADAPPDVFEIATTEAEIFHEFAAATFGSDPVAESGQARANAFLVDPLTTTVTTQLDASLAERGCAAVTKRWTINPEDRDQDPGRPVLEALYVGRFDSATGQPSQISQTVTLVRGTDNADEPVTRRDFTTTLTVTRPWG